MKNSFVMYRSFVEALKDLPPEDFKAAMIAISEYALDGKECSATGVARMMFLMAKPIIDNNTQRYQNGLKGGRPKVKKSETDGYEDEKPTVLDLETYGYETTEPTVLDSETVDGCVDVDVDEDLKRVKETHKEKERKPDPIAEAWNAIPGITPIRGISGKRRDALRARIREHGEEGVLQAIEKIKESAFLRGQGDRGWVINFDWFVKPSNFQKVLEGTYTDKREVARSGTTIQRNAMQRNYDFEELERSLIQAQQRALT